MNKKEFYEECNKITGIISDYTDNSHLLIKYNRYGKRVKVPTHASRWGGREPGNGRYYGLGLIRVYNDTCIHINIRNPNLNKVFYNYDDALIELRKLFKA